jgi:hypothetical protein
VSLEDTLKGWTGPSSDSEQDKQERTERMVREAIAAHAAFKGCSLSVYAKGSYANNGLCATRFRALRRKIPANEDFGRGPCDSVEVGFGVLVVR